MRTTLNIDDDVMAEVRALAEREDISLGKALSELARRGIKSRPNIEDGKDWPVIAVPLDAGPITNEDVYCALNEWP